MFEKIRNDPKAIFRDLRTWKKKTWSKKSRDIFPFKARKRVCCGFVCSPETILSPQGLKAIQFTCLQQNSTLYKKQIKNYQNLLCICPFYIYIEYPRVQYSGCNWIPYLPIPTPFTGFCLVANMRVDLPVNLKWARTTKLCTCNGLESTCCPKRAGTSRTSLDWAAI
jgi:hypothetical protein